MIQNKTQSKDWFGLKNLSTFDRYTERLFLLCWAIYFFYLFVTTTMFHWPAWFSNVFHFSIIIVTEIALYKLYRTWFDSKLEFAFMILFLIIGIRYQLLRHDAYIRETVLMCIGAKNVDFRKIVKLSLGIGIAIMVAAFAASQLGLIEDLVYAHGTRHSFGICYPTDFAAHVFFLLLGYLYLRQGKMHIWEYVLIAAFTFIMFKYTRTRNNTICMYFVLVLSLVWQFFVMRWPEGSGKNRLLQVATVGSVGFVVLCVAMSLILTIVYPENAIFRNFDSALLGGRYRMGHEGFLQYGIHLTGSDIPQMGNGSTTVEPDWYFFLDISYITVLLCRGLAVFVMMLIVTGRGMVKCIQKRNLYGLLLFAAMALQCSVEHHWAEPQYNYFYLMMFAAVPAFGAEAKKAINLEGVLENIKAWFASAERRTELACILFFLAVFLKQFYLLPSGSVGVADLFFAAASLATFFSVQRNWRKFVYREDIPWGIFLVLSAMVNGFYYIQTRNLDLPLHTMYWIYSAVLIWTFRTLHSEHFMDGLCWICRCNIVFQLLTFLYGRGRYFYEPWGGTRLMGTFNDPNQFAFFIFTMILVLFMEYRRSARYTVKARISFWGMFLIGVFLIVKAKSTGMFVGLLAFFAVLAGQFFWDRCCHSKRRKLWWIGGAVCVALLVFGIYWIWPDANFDVTQPGYTLLARIRQKIWKLSTGNIYDLLYDRSAERLVLTPQYLLYGAGEGYFERFIPYEGFEQLLSPGVFDVFHVNEIHSSFFDVWFSYGLIPTAILVYWIGRNVRRCAWTQLAAVLALLAESFTLMNCRQPFFWFIIVMAGMSGVEHDQKEMSDGKIEYTSSTAAG